MKENLSILLVEDEPGDAFLVEELLSGNSFFQAELSVVQTLQTAMEKLKKWNGDIILLDLGLPDSVGLDSLKSIINTKSPIPILVITGLDNEEIGRESIVLGAQTFLVKGKMDSSVLTLSILHSIQRNRQLLLLKERETELANKNMQLVEANKSKDRLMSMISNDLKGPFSPFLGLLQLMVDKFAILSDEVKKTYLQSLLNSARSIDSLLENLLLWAVSQSDRFSVSPVELSCYNLIQDVLTHFKQIAGNKEIIIQNNISNDVSILADYDMCSAVFRNLISNAIKFSPRNSVIYIGCEQRTKGKITFYVKDQGVGIEKANLRKIFSGEAGFTTIGTEKEKGTGFGMLLCKDFVEKQGGEIWVESEPGKGTTFYFTLPDKSIKKEKIKISKPLATDTREPVLKRLNILLAEDDETSEILIRLALENLNAQFIKARTGIEAVDACRLNPDLDLILMDIKMPVMNGYEATRQIRKFNKDIVIVAQTSYALTGDREKAIEAGCNDYISKPIRKDYLMEIIHKHFAN